MNNSFSEKLIQGLKPIGSFSTLCSSFSVECMAISGMDYVIIDMEHGPAGLSDVAAGIQVAELRGMTPFVRLSSLTRDNVIRLLDLGTKGLIAPCVQGIDDAKRLIEYSKYSPIGQRGLALSRSADWGSAPWISNLQEYMNVCNEMQLLILQCETIGCYEQIEQIAALPEVAGIFIGPFDLSAALGIPGQFQKAEFQTAVVRIRDCCHNAEKFCIIYANSAEEASTYLHSGMDSVAIGMDSTLYISMYKKLLAKVRGLGI